MLETGDKAPNFNLPVNGGGTLSLKDLKGKAVVMYFYPKDMTPGCTTEAQDFRDHIKDFQKAGAVVVGVSKDSVKRHDNFVEKQALPFQLIFRRLGGKKHVRQKIHGHHSRHVYHRRQGCHPPCLAKGEGQRACRRRSGDAESHVMSPM
jgi:peroxiredoxin